MEIHQKKAGPDNHRLKTMVKRSIEQNLRIKNFGARNGNYERNAVVKNQGTKQRGQRTLGDCWQWNANGQCSEGDNCSFRHDINNKRAKSTQPNPSPSSFMRGEKCVESPKSQRQESQWQNVSMALQGLPQRKLAPIHSVKKCHPPECLFYKSKSGCRLGEKCSYAHRQVEEQPSKKVQVEW